ncbi:hypothetical protein [Spongiibacter tropicus]|uniref:hypothetical protein n=1 Tax=Spongiibacter tropicus TaxID=454602 RepID=UPI0003B4B886|nr:hypothetical protein [Spongiibacter tropicus]
MNDAMLNNITIDELETHLWLTEPYSSAHNAVLKVLDERDELDDSHPDYNLIRDRLETIERHANVSCGAMEELVEIFADSDLEPYFERVSLEKIHRSISHSEEVVTNKDLISEQIELY